MKAEGKTEQALALLTQATRTFVVQIRRPQPASPPTTPIPPICASYTIRFDESEEN